MQLKKQIADAPGDHEIDRHGEEVVEGGDDGARGNGWIDADAGEKEGRKDAEKRAGEAAADEADADNGRDGDGSGRARGAAADQIEKIDDEAAADAENGAGEKAAAEFFDDRFSAAADGKASHRHDADENGAALQADIARHARDERDKKEGKGQDAPFMLLERGHHAHIDQAGEKRHEEPGSAGQKTAQDRIVGSEFFIRTCHPGDRFIGQIFHRLDDIFMGDDADQLIVDIDDGQRGNFIPLDDVDHLFARRIDGHFVKDGAHHLPKGGRRGD